MDLFIKYVKEIPCLWHPLHKSYRDTGMKDEAWRTIVNKLKSPYLPDVSTAKAEWKKLRDNHRDSLKRHKAVSSGNVERINTWKYAEQMEFLVPHMKLRKRPFVILPPNRESDTEDNSEYSAAVSHSMKLEESHDSEHSRSIDDGDATDDNTKRRRKEDLISFELMRDNYTYEQPSEEEVLKRESIKIRHPLDSFFESMCETTKQFPVWLQKKVKRHVFQVISEAEDCLDSAYERPVPTSSNYAYASTSTGISETSQSEEVSLKLENDPL